MKKSRNSSTRLPPAHPVRGKMGTADGLVVTASNANASGYTGALKLTGAVSSRMNKRGNLPSNNKTVAVRRHAARGGCHRPAHRGAMAHLQ